ncbi:hypothetical protein [Marivita sp.]
MEAAFFLTLVLCVIFWRWVVGFALLMTLSDYLEDFLRGRC